ncbi:MAG: YIP1 family protein [Syntrophomonadaceae bacterium]|jgi:hypothetical protein
MDNKIKISLNRLWQVIFQPGKVWENVEDEPVILLPMFIILSLNLFMIGMIMPEMLNYSRNILTSQGMAPDIIKNSLKVIRISMIVGALLIPLVTWMVHAALLAIFNQMVIVKDKLMELFHTGSYLWWLVFVFETIKNALISPNYKRFFLVAFYAWIPVFIGKTLEKVLIILKVLDYEQALTLWTSAAILLPPDKSSGFLYIFLNYLDIFTIWGLCLLVAGGAAIMNRNKKELAAYLFIIWFIYLLIKAGINSSIA